MEETNVFRRDRKLPCTVTTIEKLDMNKVEHLMRGGVVMCTESNGEKYLIFAIDDKTHELTDFGGTREKKDANIIDTSIREFHEETLGLFDKLSWDDIKKCTCVYDSDSIVLFIRTSLNINDIAERFLELAKGEKDIEVCGIMPVSILNFIRCMKTPKPGCKSGVFYHRLERLLRKVDDIHDIL